MLQLLTPYHVIVIFSLYFKFKSYFFLCFVININRTDIHVHKCTYKTRIHNLMLPHTYPSYHTQRSSHALHHWMTCFHISITYHIRNGIIHTQTALNTLHKHAHTSLIQAHMYISHRRTCACMCINHCIQCIRSNWSDRQTQFRSEC